MHVEHVAWVPLIPLLPLAGFLINGLVSLLRPRGQDLDDDGAIARLVSIVGCGAPMLALALSAVAFQRVSANVDADFTLQTRLLPWLEAGWFKAPLTFQIDRLSAIMCLVVTGVGTLIHVYSTAYMKSEHPGGYARYFAYLNLFTFSMLVLVTGANLPVMFLGWEGVGLCSYLLIGFWYSDAANCSAGRKAFIVNRVGDAGFILGMLLLAVTIGPLDYPALMRLNVDASHDNRYQPGASEHERFAISDKLATDGPLSFEVINELAPWIHGSGLKVVAEESLPLTTDTVTHPLAHLSGPWILTLAALLLFVGATGKSAQIPLYVWLPDAMAGPTPVSALIHAATMVTAGVYMVARLNGLFASADGALTIVATVGALTAVFAASIALTQNDIKKILAWSTISQLGYMFMAVGCAAFTAGIFHLVTHAFFKALLFLAAGAVMHGLLGHPDHPHGVGDLRLMGGLRQRMPLTFTCFLIGGLALAGLPPFAGFFSKDTILFAAYYRYQLDSGNPTWLIIWILGVLGAFLTAFYITRLIVLCFLGEPRFGDDHDLRHAHQHAHDPPAGMAWPLCALIMLSAVGGFAGVPVALVYGWNWLVAYLPGGLAGLLAAAPHGWDSIGDFLGPFWQNSHAGAAGAGHGNEHVQMEFLCTGISVLAASAGALLAFGIYTSAQTNLLETFSGDGKLARFGHLVRNKYWVDELYQWAFVRGTQRLSTFLWKRVDVAIIDRGVIEGIGDRARSLSDLVRSLQNGMLPRYAIYFAMGVIAILFSFYMKASP